jgi:hypothetical protein
MRARSSFGVAVVVLGCALAGACDSSSGAASEGKTDAKAKPSPLEPRGIEEMKRVKQDVEDAQKAGMKRTDDAMDKAMQGDAVDRGAPGR